MIRINTVQSTERELRHATKAWPEVKWLNNVGVVWLGLVALATIGLSSRADPPLQYWIMGSQLLLIFGLIPLGQIVQRRLGSVNRSAPLRGLSSDWSLDQQGVRITSALSEQFLRWEGLVRVVEEKDRLIFAASPAWNHVLPKRSMTAEQFAAVQALVSDVTASGRLGRGVD